MTTYGVAIGGPYATLPQLGQLVETRGFDAVWVLEAMQDPFIQATILAGATERIDIGTNIALAFPRSPTITAMQAWDLNEITGDRFILGLGSQVRRIIRERFSAEFDPPAKRMSEYVRAMQAVWRMERGEDVTFDGELYQILRPGLNGLGRAKDRALPRTYVAAVGPLMTKVAATVADGILGHPFTSDRYLADEVVPRIESALDEAGRDRRDFTLAQGVILCISDDREVALREAKLQIAFYGSTPNYRPVFASYGDESLTDTLNAVLKSSGKDPEAMIAAVPDKAVERYAVAGTPDEVKDRLADIAQHVDHLILGGAWFKVSKPRLAENLWATLETFASTP